MKKCKSLISLLLIVGMLMTMMVIPTYAAERITVNAGKDAGKLTVNPTTAGNYTVYGNQVIMGSSVPNTFSYKFDVPATGTYHLSVDAKIALDAVLNITVGGKTLEIIGAGNPRSEIYVGRVDLTAGENTVVLKKVSGGSLEFHNFYFDAAGDRVETDFSRSTGAYKNYYIPTIIQAEDYDMGANGSYTTNTSVAKTTYRGEANLPISTNADGADVITLRTNEWANYTFTAPSAGSFNVAVKTNVTGNMEMYLDDYVYPISFAASEGETAVANIYFEKGVHTLRLRSVDTMFDVDYIAFTAASSKGSKIEELASKPLTEEELEARKNEVRPIWKEIWVDAKAGVSGDGTKANPYKTIEEAKAKVREINGGMQGDIVVKILPGEYHIAEMIKFDENDGGKNGYRVIYQGANALERPILSGGTHITNWEPHEKGVWKASVPGIKDMRTLYINGWAGVRARSKYIYNFGSAYDDPETEYTMDGYTVSMLNLPEMSNPQDLEICFNQLWTLQRAPVKDIIPVEGTTDAYVVCDQPHFDGIQKNYNDDITPLPGSKGYFENAYELLDEYGEFFFDKYNNVVYYYPYPEENLKTAEVVAGTTEFMFQLFGSAENSYVRGITFDNLDIRHGTWLDVSRTGISTFQADCLVDENQNPDRVQANGRTMPAVMQVRRARDITVTNCNFQNIGCSAIFMDEDVEDSVVDGNIFRDLSGTAVTVGSWRTSLGLTAENMCEDINITNNVMHRIGLDYAGSPAIGVYYARRINSEHNDIKDTPYTGITYGWGWGSTWPVNNDVGGHSIRYNRIDDNSNVVKDGGPIYTLGEQRNTFIQYNYLTNSRDFGGIYFDSGSAMINCSYNVLENMQQSGIFGAGEKSYGMTIKNNWAMNSNQSRQSFAATESDTEVPIICDETGWPAEAREVMANAGLERGYKRLLTGIEYPSWRSEFWEFENAINQFYKSVNIIEEDAVNFMPGGEGITYHSANNKNGPKKYDLGLNTSIGNTNDGDWMLYEIDVKQEGEYNFELIYSYLSSSTDANVASTAGLNIYVDDVKVIDKFMLPSTGSWNAYLPTDIGNVYLTPGKRIIKVEFVNAWAFQKFRLIKTDFTQTEPEFDDGVMLK